MAVVQLSVKYAVATTNARFDVISKIMNALLPSDLTTQKHEICNRASPDEAFAVITLIDRCRHIIIEGHDTNLARRAPQRGRRS